MESQTAKFLEFDVAEESSCSPTIEDNSTMGNMVSLSPPIQIIVETHTHHIKPVEARDPVVEHLLMKFIKALRCRMWLLLLQ